MFIVSLYAAGDRRAADCLPTFFATRAEAIDAAGDEIARVAAMPPEERDRTMDWAVRFTVRRCRGFQETATHALPAGMGQTLGR